MRIRIQTYSPLPEVKAWFVPDAHNIPENIANLKDELCRRVHGLKNAQYHGRNLVLVLDGFELLDDSPFSAVRDGDLICVKQLSPPEGADVEMRGVQEEPHGQKRKRSHISKEPNALSAGQPKPLGLVTTSTQNRVVKPIPIPYESESESDSSSSSSSTSSTSSSSSSSSSTSSSSTSSTSSSSTASSPSKPPSPKKAITNRPVIPKPTTTTIHVPPGLGKPSTHSRNKRRRQKREHLKSAVAPPAPTLPGASEPNRTPLGPPKPRPPTVNPAAVPLPPSPPPGASSTTASVTTAQAAAAADAGGGNDGTGVAPVYVTQDQVMMSGMRNKNKKKGFKLSMANPIPQKIVFDAQRPTTTANVPQPLHPAPTEAETPGAQVQMPIDGQPAAPTVASTPSSVSLFNATGPASHARLVPPSELQDRGALPSNMFVTSVDVEAGMWPDSSYSYSYSAENNGNGKSTKAKKNRGKKKKQRVSYGEEEGYYGGDDAEAWGEANEGEAAAVEVLLDYSEDGDGAGGAGTTAGGRGFDWDRAEKQWESALPVTSADVLTPGAFVGWKALAINPRTFSPEVLLNVARVVEGPGPDAASGKGVRVRAVRRTAMDNEAAFAFGLNGAGGEGEEGEEEGEETVAWEDVPGLEWRLLDI